MRSMMAIEDAGTRYPQVFRRVCSAGEPLNPEAIRWFREQYGVTVLDYYGLTESYPLVANYPWLEVREGSMGKPMPGWDVQILDEDEQPVAQGERGEICLRARSNPHYPLGYWRNDEAGAETFGGEWFHTKDAAVQDEDGYYWYVGRADDVIIAAGYRIGPFEVESACLEHPAVREAAAVASPDELRGNVVKAFIVLADGYAPSDELAGEIKRFVRERLSAYAYPRLIEFVPDLPKTLTGKIRRIELRQLELDRADAGTLMRPVGPDAPATVADLDWPLDRARAFGGIVLELYVDLLEELAHGPTSPQLTTAGVREAVALDVPEEPLADDALMAHLQTIVDHSLRPGSGGFMAYISGAGTVPGALVDLLASGLNANAGGVDALTGGDRGRAPARALLHDALRPSGRRRREPRQRRLAGESVGAEARPRPGGRIRPARRRPGSPCPGLLWFGGDPFHGRPGCGRARAR